MFAFFGESCVLGECAEVGPSATRFCTGTRNFSFFCGFTYFLIAPQEDDNQEEEGVRPKDLWPL